MLAAGRRSALLKVSARLAAPCCSALPPRACGRAGTASSAEAGSRRRAQLRLQSTSSQATPAEEHALFAKLELRVGEIVKVWPHETADRLWCEEIDIGESSGPRRIASGLRGVYSAEEMLGARLVVVCNLKSRKLMGFPSHGMVLCAMVPPAEPGGSPGKIEFVEPPPGAAPGDRVVLETAATPSGDDGAGGGGGSAGECGGGEPAGPNQVKKQKVFEKVQPKLSTDGASGVALYGGVALVVAGGHGPLVAPTIRGGMIS
eukprot:SAG22_NODE_70_length_22717_cov_12.413741_11_plen_260_part_00